MSPSSSNNTMSYEPFICRNRPPDSPSRMALQGLTAFLVGLRQPPGTSHHHILFKRTKMRRNTTECWTRRASHSRELTPAMVACTRSSQSPLQQRCGPAGVGLAQVPPLLWIYWQVITAGRRGIIFFFNLAAFSCTGAGLTTCRGKVCANWIGE